MENRVIRPFHGVTFSGDGTRADTAILTERTYVPDLSWASLPVSLPEQHVLRILEPAFRDDDPYEAARTAQAWLADGILRVDSDPAFYAYRAIDGGRESVGVTVLVDLDSRQLRPHEDVIAAYAIRQARLAEATHAQWEPITAFTTTEPIRPLLESSLARPPDHRAAGEDRTDELWTITDASTIGAISERLTNQMMVIADGHHRYAAWQAAPESQGRLALTLVLDQSALDLGPIHRVVAGIDLDEALQGLPLPVVELAGMNAAATFTADGETRCVLTDGQRFLGLDTYECAPRWVESVFTPHHGLESDSVEYEPDPAAAAGRALQTGGVALLLSTPSIDAVTRAASSGRLLPHKSSWFRPKPRVGMIMRTWA